MEEISQQTIQDEHADTIKGQLERRFPVESKVLTYIGGHFEIHEVIAHLRDQFVTSDSLWTGFATVPVHRIERHIQRQEKRPIVTEGEIPDSAKYHRQFYKRTPEETPVLTKLPRRVKNIDVSSCGARWVFMACGEYFVYKMRWEMDYQRGTEEPPKQVIFEEGYSGIDWSDTECAQLTPEFLQTFWDLWVDIPHEEKKTTALVDPSPTYTDEWDDAIDNS